ncbi:hypothetical protein JOC94_004731 [Bacillus thermophilus]|uniref:Uncharacterized protein n=1 Tax=Siminovitchia thermophila TaxID=1245522 RepID=A0ABS2RDG9_9BACI|nr:hypothetical protein [Siminovitchia thermophila]MBM7717700.1 hypothetical protein [Siminovitchia thermophila]ONK23356.1 hypothetical protein BLX87_11125 [Bacillus sp. VT-16-64]
MKIQDEEIELILQILDNRIKKHIRQTIPDEREDLEQEIKIKIIDKISILKNEYTPGFFEFIQKQGGFE